MSQEHTSTLVSDVWTTAQQRCWTHVEIATKMTRMLEALKGLHATAVIPILSDNRPTLMITPNDAEDIVSIKATVRYISTALENVGPWQKLAIGGEWLVRLTTDGGIIVDVMTRLPATKESPIEV